MSLLHYVDLDDRFDVPKQTKLLRDEGDRVVINAVGPTILQKCAQCVLFCMPAIDIVLPKS